MWVLNFLNHIETFAFLKVFYFENNLWRRAVSRSQIQLLHKEVEIVTEE